MSQGLSEVRKARRAARAQRNRPTLVTSSDALENQTIEESPPQETDSSSVASKAKTTKSRLPNFFSKIGRGSQETAQGDDVAAARIARATRNKSAATTSTAPQEETKEKEETPAAKPAARQAQPAAPARPTLFKSRHIIGILIYLIISNYVGIYLPPYLKSAGMDFLIAEFDFFGKQQIRLSIVIFIAVLALILILLTRFDLIPRFGGARTAQQQGKAGSSQARRTPSAPSEPKQPPPAIKQGVKGTSDKEYLAYRANQRREKKK